jgi:hypothetical protein
MYNREYTIHNNVDLTLWILVNLIIRMLVNWLIDSNSTTWIRSRR